MKGLTFDNNTGELIRTSDVPCFSINEVKEMIKRTHIESKKYDNFDDFLFFNGDLKLLFKTT